MKKSRAVIILFLAAFVLSAVISCNEVPVKETRECSTVEKVELTKQYFFGYMEEEAFPDVVLVYKNGKHVKIEYHEFVYHDSKNNLGKADSDWWIGHETCWVYYKPIR